MTSSTKLIQVPAAMSRVSPTKDGGFSLGFHTGEVKGDDERAAILSMYDKYGWLLFADHVIHEIPKDAPDRAAGGRTQSERIRAVLYRLYEHRKPTGTFEEFYTKQTEAFINRVKEELPHD